MPWTLHRYILRQLGKLLAASTAVLVVIMSFGSVIKPLSDGLLGPWALVKVLVYTMPGMLTFALPFGAALASTLVFFRLSSDNEVTACLAGGISYRELLLPVLALGLALTLGLFFLSNWVVPRFWQLVARQVERDVAGVVTQQIRKGQVVELGDLILYADRARTNVEVDQRPAGEPTPYNRMVLRGVAVGKMGGQNDLLRADYTARQAVVDLYRDPQQQRVFATMMLTGVTINDPESGTLVSVERQPVQAQEIPSPFKQEPKFLSLAELRGFANNPMRSAEVREARRQLADAVARRQMLARMRDAVRGGTLVLMSPRGRRHRITAAGAEIAGAGLKLTSGDGRPVRVTVSAGGLTRRRIEAEAGTLEVSTDELGGEPRATLRLRRATVDDPSLPTESKHEQLTLPLLHARRPVRAPLREASLGGLMDTAAAFDAAEVRDLRRTVSRRVRQLVRDIRSRLHERAALAVNCLLVLLLGAVMSMLLRRQTPLAIFFWCFMPTVVALLMISSGQNMMGWTGLSAGYGIAMLWGGNGALLALSLGVFLVLRKH